MLNAMCVALDGASHEGVARAAASLQRQGFLPASRHVWVGGQVSTWAFPAQLGVPNNELSTTTGTAYCVGALWYAGKFGTPALRQLLEELDAGGHIDETRLRGNFAAFLQTSRCCLLCNDLAGFVRIYSSSDTAFYSTSWLATCAYAGAVEVDGAAAIEYVLLGASHSDATVARGITSLPLASAYDLTHKCIHARPRIWLDARSTPPATLDAAIATIATYLETTFAEVTEAFPGRTRIALSGGFDSRLILAGLLRAGNLPELFVYGDARSKDIPIARRVAARAGGQLEVIDKRELDRQRPAIDLQQLTATSLFFDGLPNDGIWDAGSDRRTRLAQMAGGYLAMNGGGGEIFRNYFHLPDRPLSALDIVRTFYRGFDRKVLREHGALATYERRLAAAILSAIAPEQHAIGRVLDRSRIELAYPWFRCHYWMAVNNSVASRHGYYTTPLADPVSVALAWRLPLAWKNAGLLESRLMAYLHPSVAGETSAYGFRFTDGPGARARLDAWMTRARPVFARPWIAAVGRRARGRGVAPAFLAQCRALLPGEWQVELWLDLSRLPDDQALARALAIEVWWRELRSSC